MNNLSLSNTVISKEIWAKKQSAQYRLPVLSCVTELSLSDALIESIEVTTLNSDYCFLRDGVDSEGNAIWYVMDGRAGIAGKKVQLLGINERAPNVNLISVGGRMVLGYYHQPDQWPVYTSTIISLSISRYLAAA